MHTTVAKNEQTGLRYLECDVFEAYYVRRAGADHSVDATQGLVVRGDDQQQEQVCREGHEGRRHIV